MQPLFVHVDINLAIGYSIKGIDNYAHLGGLAGGFVVGMGFEMWGKFRGWTGRTIGAAAYAAVVLAAIVMVSSSGVLR